MEIGPIAGIRVMPVPRVRPADPELTPLFDIEAAARPDEDAFAGNGRKAAGAEEPDQEDENEEPEEGVAAELESEPPRRPATDRINLFA
jgi:hypothetical protein